MLKGIPYELEWPPGIDVEWKKQNQKNIVHRGWYTVVKSNVMDSSASSNAMIRDNYAGTYEKRTLSTCRGRTTGVETQKKNNFMNTWDDADMILVLTFPALPLATATLHSHPDANTHFHWFLHVSSIRSYFHIINSCTRVVIYSLPLKSCPHHPMCSWSCFSSVFPLLWFFLCIWIVFFSHRSLHSCPGSLHCC